MKTNTPAKKATQQITLTAEVHEMAQNLAHDRGLNLHDFLNEIVIENLGRPTQLILPPGLIRLAHQLGETPEAVAAKALHAGLRGADWNFSNDVRDPFEAGHADEFDATAALAGLSFAEIDALEADGERAQRVLLVREMERRGLRYAYDD